MKSVSVCDRLPRLGRERSERFDRFSGENPSWTGDWVAVDEACSGWMTGSGLTGSGWTGSGVWIGWWPDVDACGGNII